MTTVTPLPTPVPSRQDPSNFATRADEFLSALPTFGTEINLVAGEVNTSASNASTAATTATTDTGRHAGAPALLTGRQRSNSVALGRGGRDQRQAVSY